MRLVHPDDGLCHNPHTTCGRKATRRYRGRHLCYPCYLLFWRHGHGDKYQPWGRQRARKGIFVQRFIWTEPEIRDLAAKHGLALKSCVISSIETSVHLTEEQLIEMCRLLDAISDDREEP